MTSKGLAAMVALILSCALTGCRCSQILLQSCGDEPPRGMDCPPCPVCCDDYLHKPVPTAHCVDRGCCDDYQHKPIPTAHCVDAGCCDDYLHKPVPCPPCLPRPDHYRCGPPCQDESVCTGQPQRLMLSAQAKTMPEFVETGGASEAGAGSRQGTQMHSKESLLRQKQTERYHSAYRLFHARLNRYEQGEEELQSVLAMAEILDQARQEVLSPQQGRSEALRQKLATCQRIESAAQQRSRVKGKSSADLEQARFLRLSTEVELLKAERRGKAGPHAP